MAAAEHKAFTFLQVTTVSPTYAADALGAGGGPLRGVLGRSDVRAKFQVTARSHRDTF